MQRNPKLQQSLDIIAKNTFGQTQTSALRSNICIMCKSPVIPESFRDSESLHEYEVSALCQKCQDEIFGDPE